METEALLMTYFEETEELLQKAEECLIRLESGYSTDDLNELFRVAHSIKGSSQMVGYEQIGNLMHSLEDLLDLVRKGRISLDSQLLRLCFKGMDCAKAMIDCKKEGADDLVEAEVLHASENLKSDIESILNRYSGGPEERPRAAPAGGIVRALQRGNAAKKHRFCITVFFSDDALMVQPILFMIFSNIRELGSLVWSSVSDDDIFAAPADRRLSSCVLLLDTDLEPFELYPHFEMMYVDRVSIVDLSEGTLFARAGSVSKESIGFFETFFAEYKKLHAMLFEGTDMSVRELRGWIREQSDRLRLSAKPVPDHDVLREIERFYGLFLFLLNGRTTLGPDLLAILRDECTRLFDAVYGHVRGKMLFKVVKAGESEDERFMRRLNETVERMDRSRVRKLLLDVGNLKSLNEQELANLIRLKRQLGGQGISLCIVVGNPMNKRIVNLLEAIKTVEPFSMFPTERDAVLEE